MRRRLAARLAALVPGYVALIGEALRQAAAEPLDGPVGVIAVIAVVLAGQQHVPAMVHVVVPLRRVQARRAALVARQPACLVGAVLKDEMHVAAGQGGAHALGDLGDDVRPAVVEDGVHGIEAQAVEVELLEPVERVVDEEVAHRRAFGAIEIDAGAPGRLMPIGEEGLGVGVQVIPGRAEMVVDHVEEDHHAERMGAVDERLEIVGRAVGGVGREGQHAVIAPVAAAGKVAAAASARRQ